MLKTRIVTALALLAVLLPALFMGTPFVWQGLLALVTLLGAWEWGRLSGLRQPWQQWGYGLLVSGVTLWGLNYPLQASLPVWLAGIWLVVVPVVLYAFVRSADRYPFRSPLPLLMLGGMLLFIFGWTVHATLTVWGPGMLVGWILLVALADSGAYFAGRRWGRHKLAPAISPGKTWEGWLGGLALALLGAWALAMIQPGLAAWQIFLLGLVAGLSAVGDLLESALKRWAGFKDSSRLLPGHGGILDRLDSLLFAIPWMWWVTRGFSS